MLATQRYQASWVALGGALLLSIGGCPNTVSRSPVSSADSDDGGFWADPDAVQPGDAEDDVPDAGPDIDVYWTDPPDEGAPDVPPTPPGPAPIPALKDPASLSVPSGDDPLAIQPSLAVGEDGRIALTWTGAGEGKNLGIFLAITGVDGTAFGDAQRVDADLIGNKSEPSICALAGGGWVVVFSADVKTVENNLKVRFRRYTADGTPVDAKDINVATDVPGNHWMGHVACDQEGGFAITGVRTDADGQTFGVFLRRYDSKAKPTGPAVNVNAEADGDQTQPVVALAADGTAYVAWDDNRKGDYTQVYIRRMPPGDGEPPASVVVAGNELVPAVNGAVAADPASGAYAAAASAKDLTIPLMWFATPELDGYLLDIPLFKQARNHLPALVFLERSDAMALVYYVAGQESDSVHLFVVGTGVPGDAIELASTPLGSYTPSVAYRAGLLVAAWTENQALKKYSVKVSRFGAFDPQ